MTDSANEDQAGQELPPPAPGGAWPQPWTSIPASPPLDPTFTRCVGRRVAAGFIDLVPLVLITIALAERVDNDTMAGYQIAGFNLLLVTGIIFVYYFVVEGLTGTTAGKRLFGLTVIRDDGTKPGLGAVAVRTAFRAVDAIPVFYLVGFIVVLATPGKQRVGDLVGHTRVVRAARANVDTGAGATGPLPTPTTRSGTAVALLCGVLVFAGGLAGTIARVAETPPNERLGRFELDRDMVPFVRKVMSEFEHPTAQRLTALFPPGAVSTVDMSTLITRLDSAFGNFSGDYTIEDHRKLHSVDLEPLATLDLMQLKLTARFSKSTQIVIVSLGVIDGALALVHWDVAKP